MGNAFPSTSGKRWRALSYESCITSTSTKRLRNVSRSHIHHLLQSFRGNACPGCAQPASTKHHPTRRAENTGGQKKGNQQHSKKYKKKKNKRGNKKDIKLPAVPRRRGGSEEAATGPAFPSRRSAPKQSSESTAMQMGGYEFFAAA